MTQALSGALGCSVEDMLALDLNVFTSETKQSLKDGEMDLHDLLRMDKYQKIKKLSKIGSLKVHFTKITNGSQKHCLAN